MSETRRRFREQIREEVKVIALRQLADGGLDAVSVNAIGKALGVSGPGLYRYFRNRDALLTALVVDAYADLCAAVAGARDLTGFAKRFRSWALAQPHRYRLLFAAPFPGHDDLAEPIVTASHELMRMLVGVFAGDGPQPRPRLRSQLARWAAEREGDIEPEVALRAILVWARLHGFVGLEIEGNFASMGLDADLLFAAELASLGRA